MSKQDLRLSAQAIAVLEMIAAGSNYEQILSAFPHITYLSIFDAAREALNFAAPSHERATMEQSPAKVRARYPRQNQPWTSVDDEAFLKFIRHGLTVARIANRLGRQRSEIRRRITKLNLIGELSPREQSRLRRISALDPREPTKP